MLELVLELEMFYDNYDNDLTIASHSLSQEYSLSRRIGFSIFLFSPSLQRCLNICFLINTLKQIGEYSNKPSSQDEEDRFAVI